MEFTKDGRSYEERTRCTLMDGIGYVTELLNSQERESTKEHMNPSNMLFNKLYHKKLSKTAEEENQKNKSKNRRYNKILNETVKNSAPQFYVEQSFKTDSVDNNAGRYSFKLDPNFMSCNSVYKTIGLRGVFMKPKRYTLRYACDLNITVPSASEKLALTHQPTIEYKNIGYKTYLGKKKLESIEATIYDSVQNEYFVFYRQDYRTGKPISLSVQINDNQSVTVHETNSALDIDIGNNKKVDFEFYPEGEVYIRIKYTLDGVEYCVSESFDKVKPFDTSDTSCKNCVRIINIHYHQQSMLLKTFH